MTTTIQSIDANTSAMLVGGQESFRMTPGGIAVSALTAYSLNGGSFGFRNRIINGDMRMWQRGLSMSSGVAAITFAADRWIVFATGAAVTAGHGGGTGDGGQFTRALYVDGAVGNTAVNLIQRVESLNCWDVTGKPFTVKARVFSSDGQDASWTLQAPDIGDTYGAATLIGSGLLALSPGWNDVTFNFTANAACTRGMQLQFAYGATGAGVTRGITGVQMEAGPVATPFEFIPFSDVLSQCERYYETVQGGAYFAGITAASFWGVVTVHRAYKRVVPTVTRILDHTLSGATGVPYAESINERGFRSMCQAAGGATLQWHTAYKVEAEI